MAQNGNGHKSDTANTARATWTVKSGLAQMLKGGVIMDVVTADHARIAEEAGAIGVDYVDESEVLTPADERFHIDKRKFDVPFVCGARDLGEALRRISEGAAMIRSKGEAGTGNIGEAVRHIREITGGIEALAGLDESQLREKAAEYRVPLDLVRDVAKAKRLPVVLFGAGGVATPADAALMMQLGAEGDFVGSGIFKSYDPERSARAIVE